MDQAQFEFLISDLGQKVISEIETTAEPLAAVTLVRKKFPNVEPDLISSALSQAKLQAKVRPLIYPAHFLLTDDGVQQATRPVVAKVRAKYLLERFGKLNIVDLTCGLGLDSYYFAEAGHKVTAIELDPEIAKIAMHNLAPLGVQVVNTNAQDFKIPVNTDLVFVDPARRDPNAPKNAQGQTKRLMDPMKWSPNWEFVTGLTAKYKVVAKVAPGISSELLNDWDAFWISADGDLVEAMLVSPGSGKKHALLINKESVQIIAGGEQTESQPIGTYLIVPNSALIRASALNYLAKSLNAGLVNEHIAWLTSSDAAAVNTFIGNPAASAFEMLGEHKFNELDLANYVTTIAPDSLTIMTRGIEIDPEQLRKKLLKKPTKGGGELVLAIYRDDSGAKVLSCRRLAKFN